MELSFLIIQIAQVYLFLNNATGIYKVTPEMQRTIWLLK